MNILRLTKRIIPVIVLSMSICLSAVAAGDAQELSKRTVTLSGGNVTLAQAFAMIKKQTGLTVFYGNQLLNDQERVQVDPASRPLDETLNYLLKEKKHPL